jgi:hypothetical protein
VWCQEVYGEEHVQLAGALNTLGGAYAAQKNLVSALPAYRQALAILQKAHGEMHSKALLARYNLVAVLKHETGMAREALELIMPVLHMHEQSCTEGDLDALLGEPMMMMMMMMMMMNARICAPQHAALKLAADDLRGVFPTFCQRWRRTRIWWRASARC